MNRHTKALDTPGVPATNQELGEEESHEAADVTDFWPFQPPSRAAETASDKKSGVAGQLCPNRA